MLRLLSVAEFSKIIDSPSVEQAFGKYMSILDSESWDFSSLSRVMEVVKGAKK